MDKAEDKVQNARKPRRAANPLQEEVGLLGRVPPQAVNLEEAVLGAMMLEKGAVNDAIDILSAESFYKDSHQMIYGAIQDLFANSEPIDILTVSERLRRKGQLEAVGGVPYLSKLTERIGSSAHVEYHSRIISQKFIQRELIRISSETIRNAYDDTMDVFDLLNEAESELFGVAEGNIRKSYDSMSSLIGQSLEEISRLSQNQDGVSGVPTGFVRLDAMTAGWQKSDMIVLAARPGMGKTAFVLSMARNVAVDFERPVAVFSLEMSSVQLVNRLIASETGISAEKLRKGDLTENEFQELTRRISRLADAPIFIDDTPGLSIFELRAKCRRLKQQHDIEMVLIDYLQLMSAGVSKGNREQEISTISRSIKEIAKELNVPVIALSQLSRSVETRGGDKRPLLSDLRESGAIEQDADIVTFIYRPEYYGITEDENGPTYGRAEIILAKHRNGGTGAVPLKFIGELAKFDNLDEDRFEMGGTPGGALQPNTSFDSPSAATERVGSRMNDMDSGDPDSFPSGQLHEDPPF